MKHTKRLLALLLVMAMVMVNVPAPVFAVGTTNADGYIEVRTIEDLYNIRDDLTANYILMNDIDLTEATAKGGDWDFDGRGWNPIGSGDNYGNAAFEGTFDGNGHTISGMRIEVTSLPSGTGTVYLGLFANVTGTVRNLTLTGGSVSYASKKSFYIGSLAGALNGKIENCHNEMSLSGKASDAAADNGYVGGIVGIGQEAAQLIRCSNTGSVKSYCYGSDTTKIQDDKYYAGGIAGIGNAAMVISECYNTGAIAATSYYYIQLSSYNRYYSYAYASGISHIGKINDSYNTGSVSATTQNDGYTYAYGIGGTATRCYNTGAVSGSTRYAVGTGSTNCYYLNGVGTSSTGSTALTQEQMKLQGMYRGFDFNTVWILVENGLYEYPQLKQIPQETRILKNTMLSSLPNKVSYNKWEALDLTGAQITIEYENAETEVVDVTESMISGYDPLLIGKQVVTVTYQTKYMTFAFTFEVTVNDYAYQEIRTIQDLYAVRDDLRGNYILMNDIDLSEATAEGGAWDFYGNGWNPIGSGDNYGNAAFEGTFDGNGHTISGMRIEVTSLPSGTGTVYLGLFANVTGTVRNLTLTGGSVSYASKKSFYIGSLAGALNGKIENCHNEMSLSGKASDAAADNGYVGGIVGIGQEAAQLIRCSNTGSVKSYCYGSDTTKIQDDKYYAGGIAGIGNAAMVISECYNTGAIAATSYYYIQLSSYNRYYSYAYASGISHIGKINDSYNTGSVSATTQNDGYTYAYGIGGTATRCYNTGAVSGSTRYAVGTGSTNCYYLNGVGTSSTGSTALTQEQMKLQGMFPGFDFEKTWTLNAYANHPNPQLQSNVQDLNESASIVSIISWPVKQEYYIGDELVLDGCMINVIYISGKTELISVTADMISDFDNTKAGEQNVSVTYRGSADTFPVTVKERPVVSRIELISQPAETQFGVGTAFDFSGAKIKVTYQDGSTETVDVTLEMTNGGNIYHLGEQTITVAYYGQSTTFVVTVMPVSISSLKLETLPTKLTYLENELLDLTGMVLKTVMTTGTENQVNSGYSVSGYTGKPGKQTVTIGYLGKTVSFEVTVKEKSVVELVLKAAPKKTEYIAGQAFDPTGMMIVATYDNGENAVVENFEISGFDDVPGLKTVVASFGGKFVAFPVSVIARVITDFKITSYPAKLDYLQYDVFDPTGLEVKATYNDGVTEVITDYELVGFSSNPGTYTVSVAYEGWVDSFQINVSARTLTNLVVIAPTKLTYQPGEEFDPTGMSVTACYNNGQQVQVYDYVMTGFDSAEPGTKTITVSYGGLTSAFSISVSERSQIETNGSFIVDDLVGRLGEEVRVPVTVTSNTGIAGLRHEISFETANLKFVGAEMKSDYEKGTLIVNNEKADQGQVSIVWFCSYDVKSSGTVYELIFEVQETAADGITEVKIDFADNDHGNVSGENVLFGKQDGSVEVRSWWLGDLNGDRKYAMVDLVMLAQYVAGFEMTMTEKQLLSADVNEDGSIDIHDVILLNQWLLTEDF